MVAASTPIALRVNLATAERRTCQFNPARLQERIGNVQYARKEPIGASFQVMHYRSTNNRQVNVLDFYLDAIAHGFRYRWLSSASFWRSPAPLQTQTQQPARRPLLADMAQAPYHRRPPGRRVLRRRTVRQRWRRSGLNRAVHARSR